MRNNSTSSRRRSSSNENRRAPYQERGDRQNFSQHEYGGSYSPRYPARYEDENEWEDEGYGRYGSQDDMRGYDRYGNRPSRGWDDEENDQYRSQRYTDFDEDDYSQGRPSRGYGDYYGDDSEQRYYRQGNVNAGRQYGRDVNGSRRGMVERDQWSSERGGYAGQGRQRDYRTNTGSTQRGGYDQGEYRQGSQGQGYYRTGRSSGY